jgi:hypothetical protein
MDDALLVDYYGRILIMPSDAVVKHKPRPAMTPFNHSAFISNGKTLLTFWPISNVTVCKTGSPDNTLPQHYGPSLRNQSYVSLHVLSKPKLRLVAISSSAAASPLHGNPPFKYITMRANLESILPQNYENHF